MKKIYNYLILAVFMFIGVLVFNTMQVKAIEVTINPNSEGTGKYIINGIQYSSTRNIEVSVTFSEDELASMDTMFKICETIPGSSVDTTRDQTNCSNYSSQNGVKLFQLQGRQDGEKKIKVIIYTDIENNIELANVEKAIVLDTTGPKITLNGGDNIYVSLGESYEELGASCSDESGIDSACTVTIGNKTKKNGYEEIIYTAIDSLGNESNVKRIIRYEVKESKDINVGLLVGLFAVVILAAFLGIKVFQNHEKRKKEMTVL